MHFRWKGRPSDLVSFLKAKPKDTDRVDWVVKHRGPFLNGAKCLFGGRGYPHGTLGHSIRLEESYVFPMTAFGEMEYKRTGAGKTRRAATSELVGNPFLVVGVEGAEHPTLPGLIQKSQDLVLYPTIPFC